MKRRAGRPTAFVVMILAAAAGWAGCSLENASAPGFAGPSEFGTSVTLTASPAQVPRDGSTQSVVTVTVRNSVNQPIAGQRLSVTTDIGVVSESTVTTGDDGRATFAFVAPASGVPGTSAVIRVLPIGANADAAVARTLTIGFTGAANATAPTPSLPGCPPVHRFVRSPPSTRPRRPMRAPCAAPHARTAGTSTTERSEQGRS